jgi:parallel beta-helix repeat protein
LSPDITPVAFFSYVHKDDEHDRGAVTRLRDELQNEVTMQLGEEFRIFLDSDDIEWGQLWQQRIDDSLEDVTLLIPIVTPSFFRREECRREVERFLAREQELGRNDLILPIYYVSAPEIDDEAKRSSDDLGEELARRQYADWRSLRHEGFGSPTVRKELSELASRMLRRLLAARPPAPSQSEAKAQPEGESQRTQPPAAKEADVHASRVEPGTRTVDQFGLGDHVTIGEALEAASPGDRVLVGPGLYNEGLTVDKPVELIGQGEREDVVITASGSDVIFFSASIGRVSNFTLRQTGGEGWYAVDITQGRLELADCDISSESLACVAVHGGADPRVRRNRIHDGKESGLFVYDQGLGTFEENEITGNQLAGVSVRNGANPTVRRNRIVDGKDVGIHVFEDGLGIIEDNEVSANTGTGISITDGGNPTVRRNRIRDGKGAGIFVHGKSIGTLEDNEISGNRGNGIEVSTGGNPTVRGNRVSEGQDTGIFVYEQGLGVFEDNEIFGNQRAGIAISEGGNPVLRRNLIHDGKAAGVYVYEGGLGTLEDNEIVDNANVGLRVGEEGSPMVQRNRINGNGYEAIWIEESGSGTFVDNDLTGNVRGAWDIADGATIESSGNEE